MMRKTLKNYLLIIAAVGLAGCVEPITNTQTSSAQPSIDIFSPASGDSVMVGQNLINYQASDGADGEGLSFYEVYVNDVFTERFEQNTDGTNPVLYLNIGEALLGKRISYFVKVYNKNGKAKESEVQTNIYVKDRVPEAPSNLVIKRTGDYTVTLLWQDNSTNEDGFEVWRKEGTGSYSLILTLPPNTISTIDNGVSPFTDYFYKIRAFNESGNSEFSNEVSTSSLPGGLWNLQAEAIGTHTVILKWNDFAVNELGFKIERYNSSSGVWELIDITGPNETYYEDHNVEGSKAYKYRVAYFTATSVSGYSNEVTISTYYTDVEAPSNLNASMYAPNTVRLEWLNNDKLKLSVSLIVERRIGTTGEFKELMSVDSDTTFVFDTSVSPGVTYQYRVRQKLGNRIYTDYSNIATITVP
ncbi:fibronectin type III domain-containing protein [Melioribacter sp. Ez-97]|uniref:fibronectin type III domain-containing protein n=1 Tax=Melioribacter sp. Ez-97 TaxID=3423434 RepID=UPI003EDA0A96